MSDDFKISIDGKSFTVDPEDLELGEVELLEETLDAPLNEIDFTRAKAMRVLVYLLMRRDDPNFSMEDAGRIKLGAFKDPVEPEKPARPTRAAKRG